MRPQLGQCCCYYVTLHIYVSNNTGHDKNIYIKRTDTPDQAVVVVVHNYRSLFFFTDLFIYEKWLIVFFIPCPKDVHWYSSLFFYNYNSYYWYWDSLEERHTDKRERDTADRILRLRRRRTREEWFGYGGGSKNTDKAFGRHRFSSKRRGWKWDKREEEVEVEEAEKRGRKVVNTISSIRLGKRGRHICEAIEIISS